MTATDQVPIRLFTYPNSPFGAKLYWALLYKRIEFELVHVGVPFRKEIAFTDQHLIPVLEIDAEWVQDSSENCLRLDKRFSERPFAGGSAQERRAIVEADEWVTERIVGLHFLSCIDKREGKATVRNCRRMASAALATTHNLPPWVKKSLVPIWHIAMRHMGFVKRGAHRLDTQKRIAELAADIASEMEERIAKTGFLAGTDTPSFADIGAFAELAFLTSYEFEGTLQRTSSPAISSWYDRMCSVFPASPSPALFPEWPPVGFASHQNIPR